MSATQDLSDIAFQGHRRNACEYKWDSKATVLEQRTFNARTGRGDARNLPGDRLTGVMVMVGRGHRTQTLKQMRVVASENSSSC